MDYKMEIQHRTFALMTEENHEKTQSGWSAPGFEPGTSRMRVSCVTTEPTRSVKIIILLKNLFIFENHIMTKIIYLS